MGQRDSRYSRVHKKFLCALEILYRDQGVLSYLTVASMVLKLFTLELSY